MIKKTKTQVLKRCLIKAPYQTFTQNIYKGALLTDLIKNLKAANKASSRVY